MSYYSYYYDQQSEIRPARRSVELTYGNKHYLLMNLIEKRQGRSYTQISGQDYQLTTYFRQSIYDRSQEVSGLSWTEVLLQKNKQEEDEIITLDPETLWQGLAKIGGYFAFLNIAVLIMRMINQVLMKKELERYLDIEERDHDHKKKEEEKTNEE